MDHALSDGDAAETSRPARAVRRAAVACSATTIVGGLALLSGVLFTTSWPPTFRVLTACALGVGLWRSDLLLLLAAGWMPLLAIAGGWLQVPGRLADIAAVTLITAWGARPSHWRHLLQSRHPAVAAAGALIVVVAASAAVHVARLVPALEFATRDLRDLVMRHWFLGDPPFQALIEASLLIEGALLLLLVLERMWADPDTTPRLLRVLVFGTAGAACLNAYRFLEVAVRTGNMAHGIAEYSAWLRINIHFPDLNAAGSWFLLAGLIAAGPRSVTQLPWIVRLPLVAVLAAGLWLSGSRTAMGTLLLLPIGAVAAVAFQFVRPRITRRAAIVAAAIVLLASATGITVALSRFVGEDFVRTLGLRAALAQAALRMTATAPFFGVGAGRFYTVSGAFITDPYTLQFYRNENAHNNFLQVLAETGLVGLTAWLLLIGTALAADIRRRQELVLGWRVPWLSVAAAAFIVTWLTGHPLLIREVAFAFWMVVGVAAARRLPRPDAPGSLMRIALPAAIVLLVLASLPFRVRAARLDADLEHIAFGLRSITISSTRCRAMTAEATLFVPAGATGFELTAFAAVPDADNTTLTMRLDGRPAGELRVSTEPRRFTAVVPGGRRDGFYELRLTALTESRRPSTVPVCVTKKSFWPARGAPQ